MKLGYRRKTASSTQVFPGRSLPSTRHLAANTLRSNHGLPGFSWQFGDGDPTLRESIGAERFPAVADPGRAARGGQVHAGADAGQSRQLPPSHRNGRPARLLRRRARTAPASATPLILKPSSPRPSTARDEMRDTDKRETRILIQTHPDVLIVPPDPPQLLIKLGQVRQAIHVAYYRPPVESRAHLHHLHLVGIHERGGQLPAEASRRAARAHLADSAHRESAGAAAHHPLPRRGASPRRDPLLRDRGSARQAPSAAQESRPRSVPRAWPREPWAAR